MCSSSIYLYGIAATLGLWFFLPAARARSGLRFDWFGFASLALGVAGLQLMLDRGESKDWFGSGEIISRPWSLYARAMLNTERHGFKSGASDPRQPREICAAGEDI